MRSTSPGVSTHCCYCPNCLQRMRLDDLRLLMDVYEPTAAIGDLDD